MNIKHRIIAALVAIVAIVLGALWLVRACSQTEVGLEVNEDINITPEQITSIKAIGEWEFLSIADEELVDTVRKGFFSDAHLSRIYYGTIRLGINLHQVEPGWVTASGDSLLVTLPAIGLLDRDFIDEARTKSFYESGKWSHQDREALYRRAYQKMLKHALTPENLRQARQNGEAQMQRLFQAMGYEHVSIRFSEAAE
jgi:hypothetical protein